MAKSSLGQLGHQELAVTLEPHPTARRNHGREHLAEAGMCVQRLAMPAELNLRTMASKERQEVLEHLRHEHVHPVPGLDHGTVKASQVAGSRRLDEDRLRPGKAGVEVPKSPFQKATAAHRRSVRGVARSRPGRGSRVPQGAHCG